MKITGLKVPCPVCKAVPGQQCVYTMHAPRLGTPMAVYHGARQIDANEAEVMANILLDS